MVEDNSIARPSQTGDVRPRARRHWNCPKEGKLAAYLDGAMSAHDRGRIESHLAECEYCCGTVADIIKLQKLDVPALPAGLEQRARALGSPRAKGFRGILLPAAATAGVVLAVIGALILRGPQKQIAPVASTPPAPLIAKSEPAPAAPAIRPRIAQTERNLGTDTAVLQLVSPKQDKVVARDQLTFQWEAVPGARYYEIHVVSPEGDLVWNDQSESAFLKFPSDVALKNGPYFVWVSASLADGRVQKSIPVRFLVSTSP